MNGGVLHAIESLSAEERAAAFDGYRYDARLADSAQLGAHRRARSATVAVGIGVHLGDEEQLEGTAREPGR
jgi:hypothetical protein